jgi:hypothetical protein
MNFPADKHQPPLEHPIGTGMSLDPETVSILRSIHSDVCESVAPDAGPVRTHIASRLLEAAHCGTTSPRELKSVGVAALLEAKNDQSLMPTASRPLGQDLISHRRNE